MIDYASAHLARVAYEANASARFRRLDRYEQIVDGNQYEGRAKFSDDTVPLLERAPSIVYTLVGNAIRSHASMVCGEGRFPRLTTHGDEDGQLLDQRFGLSKDDSAILDPLICAIVKQTKLRTTSRRLLEAALGCGTSVPVVCARNGRLAVDTIPAKWCTPTFDENAPGVVTKLEIRYPYLEEVANPHTGKPDVIAMLYRRVIDETSDITYQPARANRNGAEPTWLVQKRYDHDLGFCPVVWYKHAADEATVAEIDGRALHRTLLDEIYALDLARSQLHRAVVQTLDPILAEIGVDPDFSPAPMVGGPRIDLGNPVTDPANRLWGNIHAGPPRMGRKRAPGMAYQYPPGAEVKYLTVPGDAMTAGEHNVSSLYEMICDSLHWRPMDPESMKQTALSGRALEWLHRKQIDFDNELRTDFGDHCLLPLVDLLLRAAYVLGSRRLTDKSGKLGRSPLYLRGVEQALPILARFFAEQDAGNDSTVRVWMPPEIDLVWPPYFPPTELDAKAIGDNVRADLAAKIITRRTAVEKVAPFYGIADINAYVVTLEQDDADAMSDLHAAEDDLAEQQPPADPDDAGLLSVEATQPNAPASPTVPQPKPAAQPVRKPPQTKLAHTVALPKGKLLGRRAA